MESLEDVVEQSSLVDKCNQSLRIYLPNLTDPTEEGRKIRSEHAFFIATVSASDGPAKAVGLFFAYSSGEDEIREVSPAMVHPQHRRQGLFKRMLQAATDELTHCTRFVFTVCDQAEAGVACATHMGFQRDEGLDQYLQCFQVPPPAGPGRPPLPIVKLEQTEDVEEVFSVWETDRGPFDSEADVEEQKKFIRDSLIDDKERCLVLRLPEETRAPVEGGGKEQGMEAGTSQQQNRYIAVGTITYAARKKDDDVYFLNVIVRPEYQKRGLGEAMVREATRMCFEDMHKKFVALETPYEYASRLYQRAGFVVSQSFHQWAMDVLR